MEVMFYLWKIPRMPTDDLLNLQRGLRSCLKSLDVSVAEAEMTAGLAEGYLKDVLSGKSKSPGILHLRKFTVAYKLSLDQLFEDAGEMGVQPKIPLRFRVAAAFSEARPDMLEITQPKTFITAPPGLPRDEGYFAAHVVDGSADELYPPGSTIFCRPIPEQGVALRLGKPVLVRFRTEGTDGRETMEVLVGLLDQTSTGDIILITRSTMSELPRTLEIRRHETLASRFSDASARFGAPPRTVNYRPEPVDRAEIVGQIVSGFTMENAA